MYSSTKGYQRISARQKDRKSCLGILTIPPIDSVSADDVLIEK